MAPAGPFPRGLVGPPQPTPPDTPHLSLSLASSLSPVSVLPQEHPKGSPFRLSHLQDPRPDVLSLWTPPWLSPSAPPALSSLSREALPDHLPESPSVLRLARPRPCLIISLLISARKERLAVLPCLAASGAQALGASHSALPSSPLHMAP